MKNLECHLFAWFDNTTKTLPTFFVCLYMCMCLFCMYIVAIGSCASLPFAVISPVSAAALRGVALTRGRAAAAIAARGVYGPAAAAQLQLQAATMRHPTPLPTATALPYATMQYAATDPLIAYAAADRGYQLVTTQPYAAGYPGAATRYAIPAMAQATNYAAAAAAAAGYGGRELAAADPYLGSSIGPVAGYGATLYRGAYQRFTPY